jgi:hypothetical protein
MDETRPLTYVERTRRALLDALPPELDKAGIEWNPATAPRLFDLYALLVLVTSEATTLKDVHDAWAVYTQSVRPSHQDLIPFGELSAATAAYDQPFRDAIVNAAVALRKDGHA